MADNKKRPDIVDVSDVNSNNGFESLQSQLDAFLEQEKGAIAKAGTDSNESQHRLDYFINNLQQELDSLVGENSLRDEVQSISGLDADKPKPVRLLSQSELIQPFGKVEKIPLQQESKQPATAQPVTDIPTMSESTNSGSYSKFIFRVLIGASCVTAFALWFLWPLEQASTPQMLQQHEGVSQSLPIMPRNEITTVRQVSTPEPDEPVASKVGGNAMSDSAPVVLPKEKGQGEVLKLEKAAQAKPGTVVPGMVVRLKVAVEVGNIRSKPDRSGKVLFRLVKGAMVTKLAEQNDWFQVRLRNGTVAWAHRSIF